MNRGVDARSAWMTAPLAARLAGDAVIRCFDELDAALAFVAEEGRRRAAAQRQARRRRRLRHALAQFRVEVDVAVIDRLIERGHLLAGEADDREAVENALGEVIITALKKHVTA
jgi:hypothetical protein